LPATREVFPSVRFISMVSHPTFLLDGVNKTGTLVQARSHREGSFTWFSSESGDFGWWKGAARALPVTLPA
jgi:hypothetical protein